MRKWPQTQKRMRMSAIDLVRLIQTQKELESLLQLLEELPGEPGPDMMDIVIHPARYAADEARRAVGLPGLSAELMPWWEEFSKGSPRLKT
jgi:hypothetical protein